MKPLSFIKSRYRMVEELNELWDNYPLYKFICDAQWIRKRELDICECLTDKDRNMFIELTRFDWLMDQDKKNAKTKSKKA